MLKGIPSILSPQLLKIMMEMGHGDELVIAGGNFPAETCGRQVVRLDGHGVAPLLDAVLQFFPLDACVERPVTLIQTASGEPQPDIWKTFATTISRYEPNAKTVFTERYAFYERAKKAYAVVATGDPSVYADILLRKGVV